MSYNVHDKEAESLINATAQVRYEYFINKTADFEEIWSVGDDAGWATMEDENQTPLVPVWPAERFARMCCVDAWKEFRPRSIELDVWMSRWFPGMIKDGKKAAVFVVPSAQGVIVSPEKLQKDLERALESMEK